MASPTARLPKTILKQSDEPWGFSDADGTLERWQMFHRLCEGMVEFGLQPSVVLEFMRESYAKYKDREGSFLAFADAAVEAYQGNGRMRGIRVDDLKMVARRIVEREGKRVNPFTRELLKAAREVGYHTALISGSPTQVIEELAKFHGIEYWIGTQHPSEEMELFPGGPKSLQFTGGPQMEWVNDKKKAVEWLTRKIGYDRTKSFAIGDSTTDIKMLDMADHPIAYNPNDGLFSHARNHGWPIVIENAKKVYIERYSTFPPGVLRRVSVHLAEILPRQIVTILQPRLEALGLATW